MNKITKMDWAYLAGVIDSDGCIGTQKNTIGRTYRPYLVVIQRDMVLIEWLFSKFEGRVNLVSRKRADRTDYYLRWETHNTKTTNILKGSLPYLIVKKEQAKLAIELVETRKFHGNKKGKPCTEETIQRQKEIYSRIRSLNSPETTERIGSLTKGMRQSELTEMKNRQSATRSGAPLN